MASLKGKPALNRQPGDAKLNVLLRSSRIVPTLSRNYRVGQIAVTLAALPALSRSPQMRPMGFPLMLLTEKPPWWDVAWSTWALVAVGIGGTIAAIR